MRHIRVISLALILLLGACLAGPVFAKEIKDRTWGMSIKVPHYKAWKDYPLKDRMDFVLAANSFSKACTIHLSTLAYDIPFGATSSQCRTAKMNSRGMKIRRQETSPMTYTLFNQKMDLRDRGFGIVNKQTLFGYWTRNDACFHLHISSLTCDNFDTRALAIAKSVRIWKNTDANIETVALSRKINAQQSGSKIYPSDWRLHFLLANAYLHQRKPPDPEKARRYYRSTKKLAGNKLNGRQRWLIEEGIGIAWLIENNGRKAIPHLNRALELARNSEKSHQMLASTLHNTACAYALVGDSATACGHLEELLTARQGEERRQALMEIKHEKQLRSIHNKACYKKLLRHYHP